MSLRQTESQKLRDSFANNLREAINNSGKSQADLAIHLGYENPNVISMFKSGKTRVPLAKVPVLARWLGLDAATMLRDWFVAHDPDALPVIEMYFGGK
jgi:ribosome-binding protein aMBF1 (putative translation factor)